MFIGGEITKIFPNQKKYLLRMEDELHHFKSRFKHLFK